MAILSDFLPVPENPSTLGLGDVIAQANPAAPVPTQSAQFNKPVTFNDVLAGTPESFSTKMQAESFNWDRTQASRFVGSDHYATTGFQPFAQPETVEGKTVDPNEEKYAHLQTWGDVTKNALAGGGALALSAGYNNITSWGHTLNAIFDFTGSDYFGKFKERFIGTPEEQLAANQAQNDIMNKYAIYHSASGDNGFFNREFVGNSVQQLGFSIGTGAEMLVEMWATAGIAELFAPMRAASGFVRMGRAAEELAEATELTKNAKSTASTGEAINSIRKMAEVNTPKEFASMLFEGAKKFIPFAQTAEDISYAKQAGAAASHLRGIGVAGIANTLSTFNAAKAEAMMESANTYGQLYGDLLNKYQDTHNGEMPDGDKLQRIKDAAYGAATDNFTVNTGLLLVMNQLEFGSLMNKFSSSKRMFREAIEGGLDNIYTVTGKKAGEEAGKVATEVYEKGKFGILSNFNKVRKDFGLGTALWNIAKQVPGTQSLKLEIGEGVQEVLQNASDQTFRDYYTNLYNGNKDLNGNVLQDFSGIGLSGAMTGIGGQLNKEGFKTFLMGATTGLLLSPLYGITGKARELALSKTSQSYRDAKEQAAAITKENIDILRGYFANPKTYLNSIIAGVKLQGAAAQNMKEALANGDKYEFGNSKDDALTIAAATAIKTGNYDAFIANIKEMGDRMTDKEFEEVYGIPASSTNKGQVKEFTAKVAAKIERYHSNFENLKDKFSDLVVPEIYNKDPKKFQESLVAKRTLDEAIQMMASTTHHVEQTLERAVSIKNDLAKIPGIGSSAARGIEVLGSAPYIVREEGVLSEELKTLKALDQTSDIKEQVSAKEEELKHLSAWKEGLVNKTMAENSPEVTEHEDYPRYMSELNEQLKDAYKGYITAINKRVGIQAVAVQDQDLEEAYQSTLDYIKLNRDHGHYVEALNVLTNPKNFVALYGKISDAVWNAKESLFEDSVKEVKARAKAEAGVKEEPQPQPTPGEEQGEPMTLDQMKEDMLRYYTQEDTTETIGPNGETIFLPREALNPQVEQYLNKNKELKNKLDSLENKRYKDTPGVSEQEREKIYLESIKKELDAHDPEAEKRAAQEKAAQVTKLRTEWAKELANVDKEHPKTPGVSPEEVTKINEIRDTKKAEINKKYKDEIAKLTGESAEQETPEEPISDIEVKRADIEKRREDELFKPVSAKKDPVNSFNGEQHVKGYLEAGQEGIDFLKSIIEECYSGRSASTISSKLKMSEQELRDVRSYLGIPSARVTSVNGTEMGEEGDAEAQTKLFNDWKNRIDTINAKYDAELAALGKEEGKTYPKLKILRSQVNIFPFKTDKETAEQAKAKMVDTIQGLSKNQLHNSLSLKVTRNTEVAPGRSDVDNPNIISNGQTLSIELQLYGKPIGFLTNGGYYTFMVDGKPKTAQQLTQKEFESFVDTHDQDPTVAFATFKEDAARSLMVQTALETKLGSNDTITLDPSEVAELISVTPHIWMDYVSKEDEREAPRVGELDTRFEVPVGDETKMIVVNNNFDSKEDIQMVVGSLDDLAYLPEVPTFQNTGMYSMAIEVAGQIQWIQLTPSEFREAEMQPILDRVKELKDKEDKTDADKKAIVDELKKIFISIPAVYNWTTDSSGNKIKEKDPSMMWDIRLNYNPTKNTIFLTTNRKGVSSLALGTTDISTPEKLAAAINKVVNKATVKNSDGIKVKAFPEELKITADNFRNQVPLGADIQQTKEAIMNMRASVYKNIVKSMRVTYEQPSNKNSVVGESDPAITVEEGEQLGGTIPTPVVRLAPSEEEIKATEDKAVDDADFNSLKSARNKKRGSAKKVLTPSVGFDAQAVEHIDKFKEFVQKTLPDFVSVEEVDTLVTNLLHNNITVGEFLFKLKGLQVTGGVIKVAKDSPFKYHEAFHAVFRLLLTDDKINQLLDIARRENKATPTALKAMRELDPSYATMSDKELEERFQEEYMADKFDKWMMDNKTPTSHVIKGFFARLLDWIKGIFTKLSGSEMEGLFRDIKEGKYKNANLQNNQFTNEQFATSTPVYKVIKIGEKTILNKDGKEVTVGDYLPSQVSSQLSSNMAALFYKAVQGAPEYNKKAILNNIISQYRETYNTELPIYSSRARAIEDKGERARWMNNLLDLETVFNDDAALTSLKEAVDVHLNIMGFKQDLEDDEIETNEDISGPRDVDKAHRKQAAISHYASLSKFLRGYIGSTTYVLEKDDFGNKTFADGSPLIQTVNANKVYNGLLKVLSNNAKDDVLLDRLLEYRKHDSNPETVKFINRIIGDTGLDVDTKIPTKDPHLLMQLLKGFNQYSTKYLFTQISGFGKNTRYETSYANTRDAAKNQFSDWNNQYNTIRKKNTEGVKNLEDAMNQTNTLVGDTPLKKKAESISKQLFKGLGIRLSPMFIQYSLIASKGEEFRTPAQQKLYDLYSDINPIERNALVANLATPLRNNNNTNIFARDTEVEDSDKITTSKPYQFLMKIAEGNAGFDESVDSISFTNANNEVVYAHKYPNYSFVAVKELNDKANREQLASDLEHNSFLLSNDKFTFLADRNQLSVLQMDGLRKVHENTTTDKQTGEEVSYINKFLEVNRQPGVTYSKFNDREMIGGLLGLYDVRKQPDAAVREGTNIWYRVPVMLRTIEAKSTAHFARLAVISVVETKKGKTTLTKEASDILFDMVKAEFESIKQAKKEIDGIVDGTYTGKVYEGYHTKSKGKTERGLQLFNTKLMMGELASGLEEGALDPEYKLNEAEIKQQIYKYCRESVIEMATFMQEEGLIGLHKDKMTGNIIEDDKTRNILAPDFLFKGFEDDTLNDKMNITSSFVHNLSQVFINDLINTMGINKMLFGNEAKAFTDGIDQVKRMAGANADGPSMSIGFTAPNWGIMHKLDKFHLVTYNDNIVKSDISGNKIKSDDGQMYITEKGLRYMLFGFGKLTQVQVDILNKLAKGKAVTEEQFFDAGGLKDAGAFNSYKTVYFDGATYLKSSIIPLFKGALLDKQGNALPGQEELVKLREKMLEFEKRNNTVVFAGPQSASKAMKANVATSVHTIADDNFTELQSRFMRQQLENPSNKMKITDPTQMKQQIMSEQDLDREVTFMGSELNADGKPWTVRQIRNMYMKDAAQRVSNNYKTVANSIFDMGQGLIELKKSIDEGELTPKMAKFYDVMKETLQATGSDQQTLGFLETRDGETIYNLNFPSTVEKFTQLFLNYFSKGVNAEKVPGQSLALVSGALGAGKRVKKVISVWSMDGKGEEGWAEQLAGQPKQWTVITTEEYKKNPAKYKYAKKWDNVEDRRFTDIKAGDYFIDDLRHNVAEFDENGKIIGRFSEYIGVPHYKEEMDNWQSSLDKALGVRIPSDDKHSYISLKKVDMLPVQYGSIGIFPHELIEISGADFDIDKMYVSMVDTYVNKYGRRIAYGSAVTNEGKFNEFKTWQAINNKVYKDTFKENKKNDPWYQEAKGELNKVIEKQKELRVQLEDLGWIAGDDDSYDKLFEQTDKDLKEALSGVRKEIIEQIEQLKGLTTMLVNQTLEEIGLPSDVDSFIASGGEELNNGVLNNRILNARLSLLSNEGISGGSKNAIINQPTSTQPLSALADNLLDSFTKMAEDGAIPAEEKKGIPAILKVLKEPVVDVSSIYGKTVSHGTNMEGQENVGAAANAIQGISLNNQFDVQLQPGYNLIIDGESFDSFAHNRAFQKMEVEPVLYEKGKNKGEIKGYKVGDIEFTKKDFERGNIPQGSYTGERIGATLGTLLNAMTDNSKERLAARLGLNITALGYVSYMVGMGIPMESAVLLMLQPVVRSYFNQARKLDGSLKTSDEMENSKGKIFKEMLVRATARLEKEYGFKINEGIPDEVFKKTLLTRENMIKHIAQGGGDTSLEYAALRDLSTIKDITSTMADVSKVQKLTQGLPVTWEDVDAFNEALAKLGIVYKNGEYYPLNYKAFDKLNLPVDMRDILLQDHTILATNIKLLGQVQQLGKKVFLERTTLFGTIKEIAKDNFDGKKIGTTEGYNKKVKLDINSFLTIRAYRNWLLNTGRVSTLNTLNHGMIYPEIKKTLDGFKDIIDTVNDLRDKLTGKNENYLLSKFLMTLTAEQNKKDNINTVEANTWAKLSEMQQDKLISAFVDLYSDNYKDENGDTIKTHDDAVALFNYLLVKDGAQFKSGTFIRYMPNFIFKDLMDRTTEINEFLSDKAPVTKEEKDAFQKRSIELFGVPYEQLMNDFMLSYSTHIANKYFIKQYEPKSVAQLTANFDYDKSKFSEKQQEKINNHIADGKVKPVEKNPGILYINMFRSITDDSFYDESLKGMVIYDPIRKKFTDVDKVLLSKNINAIKNAGFGITEVEGKARVEFPFSLNIDGKLYTLFSVGKETEVTPSSLLSPGETIPQGVSAQYRVSQWTGAKDTFASSGLLFGDQMPVYTPKDKLATQEPTEEGVFDEQYLQEIADREAQEQKEMSVLNRLAQQGVTFVIQKGEKGVMKNGIFYPTTGLSNEQIETVIKEKESVSLQDKLIGGLFSKAELNDIFNRRINKNVTAQEFKDYTEGYLKGNPNATKEEVEYKLLNCKK